MIAVVAVDVRSTAVGDQVKFNSNYNFEKYYCSDSCTFSSLIIILPRYLIRSDLLIPPLWIHEPAKNNGKLLDFCT